MVRSVYIDNHRSNTPLVFNLKDSDDAVSGLVLINVTNLGAPKADINTISTAVMDGSTFNSARVNNRNITLTVAVTGYPDDAARQLLYEYFPIKGFITFGVTTDDKDYTIPAYVELMDIRMFNKIEHAEISLICNQPYFTDSVNGTAVFSGVTPGFEFPFSNESLSDPLISFGEVSDYVNVDILYGGNVSAGILLEMLVIGTIGGYIIVHNATHSQKLTLDITKIETILGSPIQPNDRLVVDTRPGKKKVRHIRYDVETNILNAMTMDSDWLTLMNGINSMVYEVTLNRPNLYAMITYSVLYDGV